MRLTASLVALLVFSATANVPVMAQTPTTSAAPTKTGDPLPDLWRKEQASRLLLFVPPEVIDEENIFTRLRHAELGKTVAAKPMAHTMAEWLRVNNAVIRTVGTMSVVGNRMAIRPATKLGMPDYFNTGNVWQNRTNAVNELLATLSPAQWKQIASAQGLGVDSLSGDQVALWNMVVPDPFIFDRTTTRYGKRTVSPENTRTLAGAERRQIRLHVKLIGTVYAARSEGGGQFPVVFNKNRTERGFKGDTFLNLREIGAYVPPQEEREDGIFAFGQYLAQYEPNRPRALPEAFATNLPTRMVTLPPEGEAPLTVGKLLDKISATTGLKLYAASKFRERPVIAPNTGSVTASTLLRALLFATDSTVRILPPAQEGEKELYVVAPDSEPVGRIAGRIADWYHQAQAKGWDREENDQIAQSNPVRLLRFDDDDPAAMSDMVRETYIRTVEKKVLEGQPVSDLRMKVALSDLTPGLQQEINDRAKQMADLSQQSGNNFRVRVDTLSVSCGAWLGYIIPGSGSLAGEIDADPVGEISQWMPPPAVPKESLQGRVVAVSAGTVEEARELLKAAQAAGAKEVWLQASPEVVSGAVASAVGVPVRAIVSLFGVAADTPQELPRDENLYGKKSSKWLVPDDPAVVKYVTERVRAIASVSGIAGIVLRDTVPPGYRGASPDDDIDASSGEPSTRFLGGNGSALGYDLAHRRAYLQEKGQDPADIIESLPVDLAWQEDPAAMREWQKWRHERILPIWKSLQTIMADKSVLLEGEAGFRERGQRSLVHMAIFVPWEAKQEKLPLIAAFPNAISMYPRLSKIPGMVVRVAGNPDVQTHTSQLIALLHREEMPEETLWDLSDPRAPGNGERLRALRKAVKTSPVP